ncbi:MAG: panD [Bacteroidetes bacterium]|nr:panD [Bacteroidota bacterium]
MNHTVMNAKLHKAKITSADLYYEGSCTIDMDLADACGLHVNEQVHIVNINNGERFVTYVIPGERGSGIIGLNGACARLAHLGDYVIIMSYTQVNEQELRNHKTKVLILNDKNQIEQSNFELAQI